MRRPRDVLEVFGRPREDSTSFNTGGGGGRLGDGKNVVLAQGIGQPGCLLAASTNFSSGGGDGSGNGNSGGGCDVGERVSHAHGICQLDAR